MNTPDTTDTADTTDTTDSTVAEQTKRTDPRSLLKTLHEQFSVFRDFAPLAIGIDKQLRTQIPDIDRKALRVALGIHTHSQRYLKSVAKGTARLNLDGQTAEELNEAHRAHATETLRERQNKETERRKQQREAEQRAAQDKAREQKLSQLVERFGRPK